MLGLFMIKNGGGKTIHKKGKNSIIFHDFKSDNTCFW